MNYGELIKSWRLQNRKTLEEVAEPLLLTAQALSYYENGKRTLPMDVFEKIANFFGREVHINVRFKGEVPLSKRQRRLVEDIIFYKEKGVSIFEQRSRLLELFGIDRDEVEKQKLYEDMDEIEYMNCGPTYANNHEADGIVWLNDKRYHTEEIELYYMCYGRTELTERGDLKSVSFPNDLPPYKPPMRVNSAGFIYEQRKRLLPILKDCFHFDFERKQWSFDMTQFAKRVGL